MRVVNLSFTLEKGVQPWKSGDPCKGCLSLRGSMDGPPPVSLSGDFSIKSLSRFPLDLPPSFSAGGGGMMLGTPEIRQR